MLDIPKLLREIDIVVVRILKSRDLVPKGVYLLAAVALDLLDIPLLIDAFALAEEWLKQLAGGVIRQRESSTVSLASVIKSAAALPLSRS